MYTGVYKRGNTWKWDITCQGQRRYGYEKTEYAAFLAREHARMAIEENHNTALATIGGIIDLLLKTDWSAANCKSHDWYVRNAKLILTYFKSNKSTSEIHTAQITAYILYLKNECGSSNGTINRKLSMLSKIMHKSYELGYITSPPVIHKQKEPQGRLRFISAEEEQKMFDYFFTHDYSTSAYAVQVLLDTGIRTGELSKLTIYDVNWDNGKHGSITLKDTKNSETRIVPLTKRAKSALMCLFHSSEDGEHFVPQKDQWMRNSWDRMKKAIGLQDDDEFVPHCLRHTCASRLVQRGAPLYTVSLWLGHKSIVTTKRYAHLRPEELYKVSELLEVDEE